MNGAVIGETDAAGGFLLPRQQSGDQIRLSVALDGYEFAPLELTIRPQSHRLPDLVPAK